jgi:hypothetical protein
MMGVERMQDFTSVAIIANENHINNEKAELSLTILRDILDRHLLSDGSRENCCGVAH